MHCETEYVRSGPCDEIEGFKSGRRQDVRLFRGRQEIAEDPEMRSTGSNALAPVHAAHGEVKAGTAIALSGGGYRAMLFHVGTLWRLFELDLLKTAKRISSVSGGSITAAKLALAWDSLDWTAPQSYIEAVVVPIRKLADHTIDIPAAGIGRFIWRDAGFWIERAYRRHLFGSATLQDLPATTRFVINATNLHNGRLWRFSRPFMGDWRTGRIMNPDLPLARAVAASSAFPPFLSPVRVAFDPTALVGGDGTNGNRAHAQLTDGGVYDNLGLETVWKNYETLLVSDGGCSLVVQAKPSRLWTLHAYRALSIIQDQVGALRTRQLIGSFKESEGSALRREGAYFGIADTLGPQHPTGSLPCPPDRTAALTGTATRLKRLGANHQERLINWGYAICDAQVRRFHRPEAAPPRAFPYPEAGL